MFRRAERKPAAATGWVAVEPPPKPTRWGILTSGKIAYDFALALKTLPSAQVRRALPSEPG